MQIGAVPPQLRPLCPSGLSRAVHILTLSSCISPPARDGAGQDGGSFLAVLQLLQVRDAALEQAAEPTLRVFSIAVPKSLLFTQDLCARRRGSRECCRGEAQDRSAAGL